ncbi:MAG: M6 family metalloprotease domain-containing protein [Bacteroidales bacterium]|nr:M6 family metalloprotease domain-containing protein [Bacteroidales bacterium]
MSRLSSFLISLLCVLAMRAVPARPVPFIIAQEDGTQVEVCLMGDEYFHFFLTKDGVPLIEDDKGRLLESTFSTVDSLWKESRTFDSLWIEGLASASRKAVSKKAFSGQKRGLVILMQFDDYDFTYSQADIDDQFNLFGYSKNGHFGSVHDYFLDQSYGEFDLQFDVVGPYTAAKSLQYYGINSGSATDIHIGELVTEGCLMADDEVDFADYDWDGDGEVEQIFVVYAGYGEAAGAPSYTVWPHKSSLESCSRRGDGSGALMLDGVTVNVYACSSELAGRNGTSLNGIGTACHEFSHCLGLPDLYDVNYAGGVGMSYWDLMASGSYNGPEMNGEVPCGYSAYERQWAAWLDYEVLDEMCRIQNMPCLGDSPKAYVVYNDGHPDEYFVLENRQNRGWFSYVGSSQDCHGLLVTHVDYNANAWDKNLVNVMKKHQRLSWVPADCDYGTMVASSSGKQLQPSAEELEGDLFPGSQSVRDFADESHADVGGALFNQNLDGSYLLGKPISNIREADGLISFDFMGGMHVEKPQMYQPVAKGEDSFELSWTTAGEADSFSIEVIEDRHNPNDQLMISESFDGFRSATSGDDGLNDISVYIDSFTQLAGWDSKRVYVSKQGAKLDAGFLCTPLLGQSSGGITVKMSYSMPDGSSEPLCISLLDSSREVIDEKWLDAEYSGDEVGICVDIVHFEDVGSRNVAVKISTDGVAYLESFAAYDGYYEAEELEYEHILSLLTEPLEQYAVDGIIGYNYIFTGLKASAFKARVRAELDGAYSAWTDYVNIDLSAYNALNPIFSDTWAFDPLSPDIWESIPNSSDYEEGVHTIYNLQGQPLSRITTPGIYILRTPYGIQKIIFKNF